MGYVVMCLRSILQVHEANRCTFLKDGEKPKWLKPIGRSLTACNMLLIGYGNIGKEIEKRAKAFGMTLKLYDPFLYDAIYGKNKGSVPGLDEKSCAGWCERLVADVYDPEALKDIDVVVLACNATKDNFHLINEKFLKSIKPTCAIVNVARGPLVDEEAVLADLAGAGEERRYALDVFEVEPLGDERIRKHPNIILGSHNGSNTFEAVQRTNQKVIDLALQEEGF